MRRLLTVALPMWLAFSVFADRTGAEEFTLVYKLKAGETIRSKVTHLATVDTNVKGVNQIVKTRSVSCKTWQIEQVNAKGNVTLSHAVEWVDLWNKVSDRPEIKYDSRVDEKAPPGYEHVSLSIGRPLATITINAAGRITARKDTQPMFNPGIGDLTLPLPEKPIPVGGKWHVDEDVKLQDEERRVKEVKVRHQYTLEKVETGVANIRVATQPLTPINDAKFEAQLIQRMQQGTIRFDIDAGRVLSRHMELDETVIGFSGPDSNMHYVARYSEEPLAEEVATKGKPGQK